MTIKSIATIFSIILLASIAFAEVKTSYPINQIIDVSVDREKSLRLVTHIVYPNGCYRPDHTKAHVDEAFNKILINHSANIYPGICTQAITQKYPLVEMIMPRVGTYEVYDDAAESRYLGSLFVNEDNAIFVKNENNN